MTDIISLMGSSSPAITVATRFAVLLLRDFSVQTGKMLLPEHYFVSGDYVSAKRAVSEARYLMATNPKTLAYVVYRNAAEQFWISYAYVQPRLRAAPGGAVSVQDVPHRHYVTDGRYFWQVTPNQDTVSQVTPWGQLPVLCCVRACPPLKGLPPNTDTGVGAYRYAAPSQQFVYVGSTLSDMELAHRNAVLDDGRVIAAEAGKQIAAQKLAHAARFL